MSGRRWLFLGLIVAVALVCIRLGFWQLDRLAQRRAANERASSRLAMPSVEIRGDELDVQEILYRRVLLRGRWDPDNEVVLRNRSMDGVPGVHLVTPLMLEGTSVAVLVDRGWIPIEGSSTDLRTQFRLEGTVDIEGIALPSVPEPGIAWLADPTPDMQEGRLDAWRVLNVERIQDQLPYPIPPFFVELSANSEAAGLPHPESSLDLSEGPHLGYAIQWFAFSLIAVAGGIMWLRRTMRPS